MSNTRNAILTALVEGALVELMVKSNATNIYIDDTTTLAAKLSEVITSLNSKAPASHTHTQDSIMGLPDALSQRPTIQTMNDAISAAIAELIDGAPETYNTLQEIAAYINSHEDVVTALNSAIGSKADKSTVEALSAAVNALGALSSKSQVSETDLDAALKEKVNAAAEGNHFHDNKSVLDGITSPMVSGWNGKGKFYAQSTQPAGMTANDLWARLI